MFFIKSYYRQCVLIIPWPFQKECEDDIQYRDVSQEGNNSLQPSY